MPVDPRLNCAAGICCNPPDALVAATEILCDAGCPEDLAPKMASKLHAMGVSFTSVELSKAVRDIAFGNSKS